MSTSSQPMKKVILLLNGKAGNSFSRRNAYRIIEELYDEGYEARVIPVGSDKKLDLPAYLKERKDDFDLCVCVGGDGTLHHTVNGMIKSGCDQPISYIACGTTNDFAKSLNLSVEHSSTEKLIRGEQVKLDVGLFNKEYFTYVAAFGALTDVSYNTPQEAKNMLGYTAYALNSFQSLPDGLSSRINVKIESEEFSEEGTYMYGSVSNCYSVAGIRTPILENVSLSDGLFEVVLIKAPDSLADLLEITGTLLSGDLKAKSNRHVKMFSTRKVTFTFSEKTGWTLDGEFAGNVEKATISVKKQKIKLLK